MSDTNSRSTGKRASEWHLHLRPSHLSGAQSDSSKSNINTTSRSQNKDNTNRSDDKTVSYKTGSEVSTIQRKQMFEPTYKLEPDRKFSPGPVENVIKEVLEKHLENVVYQGDLMGKKARELSDKMREKVKLLKFERFKILSWVMICEKKNNNMRVASMGLWDDQFDGFASYSYQNASLCAIGNVYAVYQE